MKHGHSLPDLDDQGSNPINEADGADGHRECGIGACESRSEVILMKTPAQCKSGIGAEMDEANGLGRNGYSDPEVWKRDALDYDNPTRWRTERSPQVGCRALKQRLPR